MKNILIGSAWPYANGSLHIGHIAALLPADVIGRYHRAKGDKVYLVSGSDCHGTPVAIRAKQENKTPQQVSEHYHKEFKGCFEKLYESAYVYEKEAPQAYCEHCETYLADRYVTGVCPSCGEEARGDQCDACGFVLEPENLKNPICAVCGEKISFRTSKHLYIAISKLEKELTAFVKEHPNWRKNAISFSERYIREGLRDRALTRDLEWGIEVPKKGYEDKKIYIWAENVLGYLSASKEVACERKENFDELWGEEAKHYYVHGKDNIPFHTIILPALLIAQGRGWHLPDEIVSSEYLTLEGKKISTSRNYAIWIKDIIKRYHPDSLRYYLLANGPEKRDSDFSWREFVNSHNSELLGGYGNFVNRTLSFIHKYLGGEIPKGKLDSEIEKKLRRAYEEVGRQIEKGRFRDSVNGIFDLVHFANKYFDKEQPWISRNENIELCQNTIFNCVQIIANLAVLLYPFLPFSSAKVCRWLGLTQKWEPQFVEAGYKLPEIEILFERIDKKVIAEETEALNG